MNFATMRARPSGEAARAMFREYDVPVDPELGDDKVVTGDGSDWTRGTPARRGSIVHDAWMDLDGNIWVNSNAPTASSRSRASTPRAAPTSRSWSRAAAASPATATACGATRPAPIWFNVNGGLAQDRSAHREDRRLHAAAGHVADRRRDHGRHRRQGHDLGDDRRRRVAFRSGGRALHRVQIADAQARQRHLRPHLRACRRPQRQRLVGADADRHHRHGRQRDRPVA